MADEIREYRLCHKDEPDGSYKTMVKFPRHRHREELKEMSLFVSEDENVLISHIGIIVHNDDAPAIVFKHLPLANGVYSHDWVVNGKYHRIGEPAIVRPGAEGWWQQGKRHRYDGPAQIDPKQSTLENWWVRGKKIENIRELLEPHEMNPDDYKNWTDAEKIMVRFVLSS